MPDGGAEPRFHVAGRADGATSDARAVDQSAALAVLYLLGGSAYGLLCLPAMTQRGFPPIDSAWTAVTSLWIAPIVVGGIFDVRPYRTRVLLLTAYCLATAFIEADTVVTVIPRHATFRGILRDTLNVYGPMHLFVGMLIDSIVHGTWIIARLLRVLPSGNSARIGRWVFSGFVVLATVVYPFAYRTIVEAASFQRGQQQAEQDWRTGRAVTFGGSSFDGGGVLHEFDEATGLEIKHRRSADSFADGYEERVRQLLKDEGIPDWSMKKYLVPDGALRAMLDSDDMLEVTKFPMDINANIVLLRRGTIDRWGTSMSSESEILTIAMKETGLYGVDHVEPVFVRRERQYPEVIFVRNGKRWIGAIHESGRLLSQAFR